MASLAHQTADRDRSAYRPDIDGLRGLAVVSVILYHLSIPGFAGGLVGVDIFFVVSGFVITRLLCSHFPDGSLTLVRFYERRVRRLAPALVTVLLGSFIAAYVLLLPADFEQFTKSLLATALCVSNFFFARQAGDYFATDAALKPLLHTWSLAVEEQFYMLYPVGLLLLLRYGAAARTITNLLLCAIGASLAMAIVGGWLLPAYSFFLLPTRVWELMLGAVVAQAAVPTAALPVRQALGVAGLICVACGIAGVRLTSSDIVPQPLLACIGTAILIYANSRARTLASALLSNAAIVWVGLISYSLYLWHWPIIVFYRYVVSRPLGTSDATIIVGATIVASMVSWVYVEQPIRRRRLLSERKAIFAVALGASLFLVFIAALGIATKGLPGRLPQGVVQLAEGRNDINPDRDKCIRREPENVLSGNFCRLGKANNATPSLMVWGDSQADTWMPVFNDLATENGITGLIAAHGGCPPLLGVRRVNQGAGRKCVEFNNAVFAAVVKYQIKHVVLVGRWSWYIYGVEQGGVEEGPGAVIAKADESSDDAAANDDNRKRVFRVAVAETVARLRSIGARVSVIDEPPTYKVEVPKYLAYAALRGTTAIGRSREEVRQRHAFQLDIFHENDVRTIDLSDYLCRSEETYCRMQVGGRSIYSDYNHLSVFGARTIAEWAGPAFKQMIVQREQGETNK